MDIRLAEADNDLTAFLTMRADTRHMIMTALREAAAAREARLKEHECSAFDPCDACAELMVEADDMGTLAEYAVEADWLDSEASLAADAEVPPLEKAGADPWAARGPELAPEPSAEDSHAESEAEAG